MARGLHETGWKRHGNRAFSGVRRGDHSGIWGFRPDSCVWAIECRKRRTRETHWPHRHRRAGQGSSRTTGRCRVGRTQHRRQSDLNLCCIRRGMQQGRREGLALRGGVGRVCEQPRPAFETCGLLSSHAEPGGAMPIRVARPLFCLRVARADFRGSRVVGPFPGANHRRIWQDQSPSRVPLTNLSRTPLNCLSRRSPGSCASRPRPGSP